MGLAYASFSAFVEQCVKWWHDLGCLLLSAVMSLVAPNHQAASNGINFTFSGSATEGHDEAREVLGSDNG